MKFIDTHVHLDKFEEKQIKIFSKKYILLTVSEDLVSCLKNLRLSLLYENVIPALGIHPWNVDKVSDEEVEKVIKLIEEKNVKVIGEVGLDKKFHPETFKKQKEIFLKFLEIAKEYNLSINLHSPNAWKEVFDLLIKYDIEKAYFHWYTGPLDLMREIEEKGYFIGINPALKIQEKHMKILEFVKIENILTESDGPYRYRGVFLSPLELENLYKTIAEVKKIDVGKLSEILRKNLSRFLS